MYHFYGYLSAFVLCCFRPFTSCSCNPFSVLVIFSEKGLILFLLPLLLIASLILWQLGCLSVRTFVYGNVILFCHPGSEYYALMCNFLLRSQKVEYCFNLWCKLINGSFQKVADIFTLRYENISFPPVFFCQFDCFHTPVFIHAFVSVLAVAALMTAESIWCSTQLLYSP